MPSVVRLMYQFEKCVEIKGDYVEKQQSCFISVTLKRWSGRKLLDPTTYTANLQHTDSLSSVIASVQSANVQAYMHFHHSASPPPPNTNVHMVATIHKRCKLTYFNLT